MRKYKLSELFDLQMGKTPSRDNPEYWDNVSHSWISIADMTANGKYITNTKEKITDLAVYETGIKPIFHGTVIMSFKLSVGKVAIVQTGENKVYSNEAIMAFEVRDDLPDNILIRNDYVYYLLSSLNFDNMGNKAVMGKTLNRGIISNTEVSLHNLEKQSEIVYVLDKVSKLIDLRNKQLQKLDELVKARFVEMFGDPVKNTMNWSCKPLNDVCDGIGDGLHGTPEYDDFGTYPFINGNNLINGRIVVSSVTKMVSEDTYNRHFINISENAILISINGTLGKLAFYNGEKVMLGKSTCYCNLKSNINKIFVYGVMKSDAFAGFLENSSTKSTIKNVGLKAMREYKLILPPMELQEQFATFVKQIDKSKLTIQKSLEKLETLKKALMQKYFG